ncbi:MAG: GNAT family N-acetyltransferase [Tannerellaceae bacterium]|nr:GNAT family N-acetyltransferase [Tannerellaceae bacterium]
MQFQLVPITKALSKASFDCGNPSLNEFFRLYALKNDKLSIGKTLIGLVDKKHVTGYLTINTAQITTEDLPEEARKKLPRYPVPAFRIGRLAVDKKYQGAGIGSRLLKHALLKAVEISEVVGLYAVIVDAIDEKAKAFYEKFGFIAFEEKPLTLFLPITTLKAAMK